MASKKKPQPNIPAVSVGPVESALLLLQGVPLDKLPPTRVYDVSTYAPSALTARISPPPTTAPTGAPRQETTTFKPSFLGHLRSLVEGGAVGVGRSLLADIPGALEKYGRKLAHVPAEVADLATALAGFGPKGYVAKNIKEQYKGPATKFLTKEPFAITRAQERMEKEAGIRPVGPKLESFYEARVYSPWLKKTPSPAAYEIGADLGEWVVPAAIASMLGNPAAAFVGRALPEVPEGAALAARVLPKLVRGASTIGTRATVEAPIAKAIVEVNKPPEERESLPASILGWAGGELVGRALSAASKGALRALARKTVQKAAEEAPSVGDKAAREAGGILDEVLAGVREGTSVETVSAPKPEVTTVSSPGTRVRITYRGNRHRLIFSSDTDTALFMVGRPKGGKSNEQYMSFLRTQFPNASDEEITAAGQQAYKKVMGLLDKNAPLDTQKPFNVERIGVVPKAGKAKTTLTEKPVETASVTPEESEPYPYEGLSKVNPAGRPWLEMLAAVREFWATRVYQRTPRQVTTKAGQTVSVYERNIKYAQQRAKDAQQLIQDIVNKGEVTEEHKQQIIKMFNNVRKNKDTIRVKESLARAKEAVAREFGEAAETPETTEGTVKTPLSREAALKAGDRVTWKGAKGKDFYGTVTEVGDTHVKVKSDSGKTLKFSKIREDLRIVESGQKPGREATAEATGGGAPTPETSSETGIESGLATSVESGVLLRAVDEVPRGQGLRGKVKRTVEYRIEPLSADDVAKLADVYKGLPQEGQVADLIASGGQGYAIKKTTTVKGQNPITGYLAFGKSPEEAASRLQLFKDGRPTKLGEEVLRAQERSPLIEELLGDIRSPAGKVEGVTTEATAAGRVPENGLDEGDILEQYAEETSKAFSPKIDSLVEKPNKRSAQLLLDKMRAAGYDVEDAASYLDDYGDIQRSDFDSAKEYKDARADAFNDFIESLRNSLDDGPTNIESVKDLPKEWQTKAKSSLEQTKVQAAPQKKAKEVAPPGTERLTQAEAELSSKTTAGKVLDDITSEDGRVDLSALKEHPDVKAGKVTHKQLAREIKRRGLLVGNEDTLEELYAGLHPKEIRKAFKKQFRAGNTRPTFRPIHEVSTLYRSIPEKYLDLLPDVEVEIDGKSMTLRGWLDKIDREAALENHHMERILLKHDTVPQFLPPEARKRYEEHAKALAKLAQQREMLRDVIEEELGDIKKREYAKSLAAKINNEKLIPEGAVPVYHGKTLMGFRWTSPGGVKAYFPATPQPTKLDESVWKSQPTAYARYLGVVRDVFGEPLVRPFRNAFRMLQMFEGHYETGLYEALKPVIKNPKSLERITLILEGTPPVNATEVELQAATKLREWYNKLFKEFGIEPERFLEDYAPRIRQFGSIRKAFGPRPPQELKFFAELEREAKGIVFPTELNALSAAMAYLRLGARKKFLQPVFKEIRPLTSKMHADRKAMWEEFENSILRRPLWEERLINGATNEFLRAVLEDVPPAARKRWSQELSALVTHMGYMGTIAGNLMSVLKNLTQQALAVYSLSEKGNPAEGWKYLLKAFRALNTETGRKTLEFCWVSQQRQFIEGIEARTGLLGLNKYLRPLEKAGFYLFEKSDELNVQVSYMMKLLQMLERGRPLAEAVEAANTFAANTQFLYALDSPMLTKTPLGRVLGMLYSWPINYVRLLHKQGVENGIVPVMANIAGLTATAWLLSKVTGLDFSSEAPLGGTLPSWMPIAYMVGGETSLPLDTVKSAINAAVETLRDFRYGTSAKRNEALQEMVKQLYNYIPFYVAGKRWSTVAKAMRNNWEVRDEAGKVKYRFGEVSVPGMEKPERAPFPGRLIPEQVRALIGATVEQRMRQQAHERIARTVAERDMLRDRVVKIYLGEEGGGRDEIRKLQRRIVELGGNPVTKRDVAQRLKEREKTAIERHAEGLRKGYVVEPSIREKILRSLLGQP